MAIKLLEAIRSATAEDLVAVRKEINDHLDAVEALKPIERILAARFGEQVPYTPRPGKKSHKAGDNGTTPAKDRDTDALTDRRQKVAEYIAVNGPKSQQKISEVTGIARVGRCNLSQVLAHPWFAEVGGLVSLSSAGDAHIRRRD